VLSEYESLSFLRIGRKRTLVITTLEIEYLFEVSC